MQRGRLERKMAKGKAWKDKTVKELQSEIRDLTKQVNTRVASIKLTRELPKDVEQAVNYMKRLSGVETGVDRTTRAKQEIGLGLKGKRKKELILQARELSSFLRWDVESEEGLRQLEAREKTEWESFEKHHPDMGWTYEEWRKLVEVTGALGHDIVNKFGSETIASDFLKKIQPNEDGTPSKIDGDKYLRAMLDAIEESEGEGMTQTELMDLLRGKLGQI